MSKPLQNIILVILSVLLSTGAAIGLRSWLHPPLHLQAVQLLPEPYRNMQGYWLYYSDNTPIYFDRVKGRWILLVLGDSTCTDACTQAQTLRELANMLKQFDGVDSQYKPIVVFVSAYYKPGDSARLINYAHSFHPDMTGMTAQKDELARLVKFFGMEDMGPSSSRIMVIDPQSRYIGFFTPPTDGGTLYTDMQQLIHQLWRYHIQR